MITMITITNDIEMGWVQEILPVCESRFCINTLLSMLIYFLFLWHSVGLAHPFSSIKDRCNIHQQEQIQNYLITPSLNNTIRIYTSGKNILIKSIPIHNQSWITSHFFKSEVPTMQNLKLFTSEEFQFAPNCEILADHLETSNEGNIFLIMNEIDETTHFKFIDNAFLQPPLRKNYRINFSKTTIEKCNNSSAKICKNLYCSTKEVPYLPGHNSENIVNIAWRQQKERVEFLVQLQNKLLHCSDSDQPLKLESLSVYHNTTQQLYIGSFFFLLTREEHEGYTMTPTFTLDQNQSVLLIVKMCLYCEMTIELIDGEEVIQKSDLSGSNYPASMWFDDQIYTSEWQEVILGGNQNCKTCAIKITTKTTNAEKGLWVIAEELKIVTWTPPTDFFSCEQVAIEYELSQTFYDKKNSLKKRFGEDFATKTLFYKKLNNAKNLCMKVKKKIHIETMKTDGIILLKWCDEDTNAPHEYWMTVKNVNSGEQIVDKFKIVAHNKIDCYTDVVILEPNSSIIYEATIFSPTSEGKIFGVS